MLGIFSFEFDGALFSVFIKVHCRPLEDIECALIFFYFLEKNLIYHKYMQEIMFLLECTILDTIRCLVGIQY